LNAVDASCDVRLSTARAMTSPASFGPDDDLVDGALEWLASLERASATNDARAFGDAFLPGGWMRGEFCDVDMLNFISYFWKICYVLHRISLLLDLVQTRLSSSYRGLLMTLRQTPNCSRRASSMHPFIRSQSIGRVRCLLQGLHMHLRG